MLQEHRNQGVTEYYSAVDFLRGMGALVILVWHYHHFYFEKPFFGPENGSPQWDFARQPFYELLLVPYHYGMWAVQFFWLLSGFVFAFVYLERSVSAKEFFVFRFSRLYPLHFLSLLLIAGLQWVSQQLLGSFQILEINDLYHFVLNLFFAQYWGLQAGYSFNSPSWSVSVEELVYWAFWLLVIFIGVKRFSGILFFCLAALFVYPVFGVYAFAFFFFFLGVVVYMYRREQSTDRCLMFSLYMLIAFLVLASVRFYLTDIAIFFDWPEVLAYKWGIENLLFSAFFAGLVMLFATIDTAGVLPGSINRFCRDIGSLTYSTYMLHLPVQVGVLMIVDFYGIDRAFFDAPMVFIVYFVFMVVLARASYIGLERPVQQYLRKKMLAS